MRTSRHWRGRAVVAATAAAIASATVVFVLPAPAVVGIGVAGVGICDAVTGEYEVTWTLTNPQAEGATVTMALMTPPNVDLAAQLPNPITGAGGQGIASADVPGTTTNVHLALDYTVGSDPTTIVADVDLPLAGSCSATGPRSLTVGPSAAGPGEAVTISGAGCGTVTLDDRVGTDGVASGGTVTGSVAFVPPLAFGPVAAAADGTWSTAVVVPVGTPPGSYAVSATCTSAASGASLVGFSEAMSSMGAQVAGFAYETRYLTVIAAVTAAPRLTG